MLTSGEKKEVMGSVGIGKHDSIDELLPISSVIGLHPVVKTPLGKKIPGQIISEEKMMHRRLGSLLLSYVYIDERKNRLKGGNDVALRAEPDPASGYCHSPTPPFYYPPYFSYSFSSNCICNRCMYNCIYEHGYIIDFKKYRAYANDACIHTWINECVNAYNTLEISL